MVVRCGHCGADIHVNAWGEPLSYAERESDGHGPRTLVVIGGDGLLHQCAIDESKARLASRPGLGGSPAGGRIALPIRR